MARLVAYLVLLGCLIVVASTASHAGDEKKTEKKRKPRFTIGKDTTVVLGPVDAHGHIDYVTALNHRLRKELAPDQNANVLLWKAFGPRPEGGKMPPEFFKWMGIAEPPQKGDYFRSLKPGPDEGGEIFEELDEATARPWKAGQLPRIATWLEQNEVPLRLVVEATKRPHYYSPMTPANPDAGPGRLIATLLPGVQKCRGFAQALTARAMLAMGEERYDDAWQDLLACHRLGRLVGKGSTLIELLVGIAVDAIASNADLAYLDNPKLDAKQIKACLADLQALAPMPVVADKIDLGERFMTLDIVMAIDRQGVKYLEGLGLNESVPNELAERLLADIDWDPALRTVNRWYDRVVAAMRGKDRTTREDKLDKIETEIKELRADLTGGEDPIKAALAPGKTAADRGKLAGDLIVLLMVPAVRKVQAASDRCEQIQRNLQLAFALAAYQRDKGAYPAKLDALAPAYLTKVPHDVFSGKPLIYRPGEKKGYLLYSVGVNGQDDGGRTYGDDPPGDDLVVRMPQVRRKP